MYAYEWRGDFHNAELNALHAEGFVHPERNDDWSGRLRRHSLGWVCARPTGPDPAPLVGFVNLAWDGGEHAFVLDTLVTGPTRRQGVGARMIELATNQARSAGCAWLHVDFEEHLRPFYLETCGFRPSSAGLIAL